MLPQPAKPQFSQDEYKRTLLDAEALLKYAAETGKPVDKATETAVLAARTAFAANSLDATTTSALLSALATLVNLVAPVTAESLRALAKEAGNRPPYRNWAISLAVIIVIYSTISLVSSTIADSIQSDITKANDLAVKLNSEFPPPSTAQPNATTTTQPSINAGTRPGAVAAQPNSTLATANPDSAALPAGLNRKDVLSDFQDYAATIRSIYSHAQQLNWFVHLYGRLRHVASVDPFYKLPNDKQPNDKQPNDNPSNDKQPNNLTAWQQLKEEQDQFELPVPLVDYAGAAVDRTRSFQQVRYWAKDLADDVSFFYGAVSSCILPVLYALLGAFAYILRTYQQQVRTRTYVPSHADSARFVIAAIGGAVVGLFSNFAGGQTVKISPLALAFLVGYAVDVFYTFLENLIQSFTKSALGQGQDQAQTSVAKSPVGQAQAQNSDANVQKTDDSGTAGDAAKAAGAGS
jgi:hypothetical protein